MKLNTLFVAAICASTMLSSCVFETAQENQIKYTHTSLVDGDAFKAIQIANETAVDGIKYAENAEIIGESKDIAVKVKSFYLEFLPQLDSIATKFDVTLSPIPPVGLVDTISPDSVDHQHADYAHQAQHELTILKGQLERLAQNTNPHLKLFGSAQLTKAKALYTEIGGKEEAHAHH